MKADTTNNDDRSGQKTKPCSQDLERRIKDRIAQITKPLHDKMRRFHEKLDEELDEDFDEHSAWYAKMTAKLDERDKIRAKHKEIRDKDKEIDANHKEARDKHEEILSQLRAEVSKYESNVDNFAAKVDAIWVCVFKDSSSKDRSRPPAVDKKSLARRRRRSMKHARPGQQVPKAQDYNTISP